MVLRILLGAASVSSPSSLLAEFVAGLVSRWVFSGEGTSKDPGGGMGERARGGGADHA